MDELGTPQEKRLGARLYGDWVSERLAARGWNQSILSRRTGIKRQTIGQIVNGGSLMPPVQQIAAIATALDASPNDIFTAAEWWSDSVSGDGDELSSVEREAIETLRELKPALRPMAVAHMKTMVVGQSSLDLPDGS